MGFIMICCIIGCGYCKIMKFEYVKVVVVLKEINVRDMYLIIEFV